MRRKRRRSEECEPQCESESETETEFGFQSQFETQFVLQSQTESETSWRVSAANEGGVMPGQDGPASQRQMDFLWNLVQGGHEMQLQQYMPQPLQTQELATQTFRNGFTSGNASAWIEDLIFRVGAVPSRSRADQAGNPKFASDKQIALYNTIAQELAQLGDQQWTQHNMQGRYSWTVSKWINKVIELKERMAPAQQQPQPQQSAWGQAPAQQPQQPQWGQPAAAPPAQAQQQWGQPAPAPAQPGFDQNGNPIPPATLDTSGPFV